MFKNETLLLNYSACYNPLIYIWMNSRFRDGFKYVFRFLPCIKATQRPDFIPHFSTTNTSGAMRRINTHLHKNGHVHSHIHDNKSVCMWSIIESKLKSNYICLVYVCIESNSYVLNGKDRHFILLYVKFNHLFVI